MPERSVTIYTYKYVTIKLGLGGHLKEDYQRVISDHAENGYRFVSVIPLDFTLGAPTSYDFIFEQKIS